jgi:hypothetical protein
MRIAKDQSVAGYPALVVRAFLRRCRFCTIVPETAAYALRASNRKAADFLCQLAALGLIKPTEYLPLGEKAAYEITTRGNAFANASAAKPVFRKTAELALERFLERLHELNANPEYVYRVNSAVLFGSMLSDIERLGDVDIAIGLQSKVAGEAEFRKWCDRRRKAAQEQGRSFGSTFDWVVWPRIEVFHVLRAHTRILSLHEWDEVIRMPKVRYKVLWGDAEQIAGLISKGKQC